MKEKSEAQKRWRYRVSKKLPPMPKCALCKRKLNSVKNQTRAAVYKGVEYVGICSICWRDRFRSRKKKPPEEGSDI